MTIDAPGVAERLALVRARIDAVSSGRRVAVVAVTKGFGADAVRAAIAAGADGVGENYAQEMLAKVVELGDAHPRWHFIGALQRNKVPGLAPHVALWQSIDRPSVAEAVARHAPGASVLLQVNLTGDPHRGGCAWDDAPALADAAADAGLVVDGLMGVGPAGPAEQARPAFAALASLGARIGVRELSMGMSDDLEVAVQEGSTMVRIGTALFGPRPSVVDLRR